MNTTGKLSHEKTGTDIRLGVDEQENGLRIDMMLMRTPNMTVDRKHFDGTYAGTDQSMIFDTTDIHLRRSGDSDYDVTAYVTDHGTGPYVVVKLDNYTNAYLPMDIAEQIADAVNAASVAS